MDPVDVPQRSASRAGMPQEASPFTKEVNSNRAEGQAPFVNMDVCNSPFSQKQVPEQAVRLCPPEFLSMLDQEFLRGGIGANAMAKLQAWAAFGTGANAKAFLAAIAAGRAALDQKVIPAPAVVRASQARAEVELAPSHLLHQARTEHNLARSEAQL